MSDLKREAHTLYAKLFAYQDQNIDATGLDSKHYLGTERGKIQILLLQFLCSCRPEDRFQFQQFTYIILHSSRMEYFEPGKAAEAFMNLESYLILLCLMPWKQEYLKLKKYGGFYQTKIESHLAGAESIFRLIGFTEISAGLLQLGATRVPQIDVLLLVAFECFLASVECRIIEDIWKKTIQTGVTVKTIVQLRAQFAGNADDATAAIFRKYGRPTALKNAVSNNQSDSAIKADIRRRKGSSDMIDSDNKVGSAIVNGASTDTFRTRLNKHLQNVKHIENDMEDIPFMDESAKDPEYTPGDFDDHLFASLQLVGEKQTSVEQKPESTKASQEWSFVKEGLEQKYGKKYFDGPRKDILNNEKERNPDNCPGGYVKVVAQDPAHKYVNIDQVTKGSIPEGKQIADLRSPSNLKSDSAYNSAGMSYPPTLDGRSPGPVLSSKGSVQHSALQRLGSQEHRQTLSEPIIKRPAPSQPHGVPVPHVQNTPYVSVQNPPQIGSSNFENKNNIQRLAKQSSVPSVTRQQMSGGEQFPTGIQRDRLRSSSEVLQRRNVTDSIQQQGAHTVNIPVRSPTATNNVFTNSMNSQSVSTKKWSCTYCTFFNTPSDIVCMMCSKSRENIDTDSAPIAGHTSKVCNQCTLENDKHADSCHVCGHVLNGTQTVV